MAKNWFGLEQHWTDSFIHWTDKDKEGTAKKLRTAFDKIEEAGLKDEMEILVGAAYRSATLDEAEANAGPDI